MSATLPELISDIRGHDAAFAEWDAAIASGRMHHGWLLQGMRGIGKAHVALRLAASALRVPEGETDHPVAQLISAGSHPDLRIVRVPTDDKGKPKSEIPVDSIRELSRFFMMRPALGGWRIAIIDSLGELNRNGANALLKTLEEPPARSLLLLVSHDGGAVLPTVRSRCRLLKLNRLGAADAKAALVASGLSAESAIEALKLAPGQPGLAMALASDESLDAAKAARNMSRALKQGSIGPVRELVKSAGKNPVCFDAAMTVLSSECLQRAVETDSATLAGRSAEQAAAVQALWREAVGLNMDRSQALVRGVDLLRVSAGA